MAKRGGKRSGAGRKKGSANKRTREIADKAAAEGITPLEYMLNVMRSPMPPELQKAVDDGSLNEDVVTALMNWHRMRYEAAKDAAPYLHPRLTATTVKGTGKDGEIPVSVSVEFVE